MEKIVAAEDKVAGLQDQLATVGTVLETAEQIAVEGKKAGRCFRRLFKLLLLISIVAVIVMVVKKVMAGRSSAEDAVAVEEFVEEAAIEEAVLEEAEIEDAEAEGDADAS